MVTRVLYGGTGSTYLTRVGRVVPIKSYFVRCIIYIRAENDGDGLIYKHRKSDEKKKSIPVSDLFGNYRNRIVPEYTSLMEYRTIRLKNDYRYTY